MKKLQDYIHLYIGCKIIPHGGGTPLLLVGVTESEVEPGRTIAICKLYPPYDNQVFQEFYVEEVQLILRPLDEKVMTQQEKNSWNHWKQRKGWMPGVHAEKTLWLISNEFDVFGLIEAGLAIKQES